MVVISYLLVSIQSMKGQISCLLEFFSILTVREDVSSFDLLLEEFFDGCRPLQSVKVLPLIQDRETIGYAHSQSIISEGGTFCNRLNFP